MKVTLQQFDKELEQWAQSYVPQNNDQLQVIVVDESGSIIHAEAQAYVVQ